LLKEKTGGGSITNDMTSKNKSDHERGLKMAGVSEKKRLVATLLCFFLGVLGIHRFYVGKIGTGILQIVTIAGFFGIWVLIDFIMIIVGKFTDKEGKVLETW
jgi:TM2 domain-containing membrane protein YozV